MAEGQRVLDLDAIKTITVKIGGKEFQISQQRRAMLEKIIGEIFSRGDRQGSDLEKTDDKEYLQSAFQEWENSFPVIALILGYDVDNKETPGVVEHLREHLSFPGATQIFQEWWALNQIDRFFGRAGNPLIPDAVMTAVAQRVEDEGASS